MGELTFRETCSTKPGQPMMRWECLLLPMWTSLSAKVMIPGPPHGNPPFLVVRFVAMRKVCFSGVTPCLLNAWIVKHYHKLKELLPKPYLSSPIVIISASCKDYSFLSLWWWNGFIPCPLSCLQYVFIRIADFLLVSPFSAFILLTILTLHFICCWFCVLLDCFLDCNLTVLFKPPWRNCLRWKGQEDAFLKQWIHFKGTSGLPRTCFENCCFILSAFCWTKCAYYKAMTLCCGDDSTH